MLLYKILPNLKTLEKLSEEIPIGLKMGFVPLAIGKPTKDRLPHTFGIDGFDQLTKVSGEDFMKKESDGPESVVKNGRVHVHRMFSDIKPRGKIAIRTERFTQSQRFSCQDIVGDGFLSVSYNR